MLRRASHTDASTSPSFVFIEFKNAHDAAFAQSAMDGHPFDSKHTFRVNRFTDIERYADMDETYVEPEPEEYKPKVCPVASSPRRTAFTIMLRRNICVLGWATLRAGINTRRTAATRSRSTGTENRHNVKSHSVDTYVTTPHPSAPLGLT